MDWKRYVNAEGDFELAKYLYRTNKDLMKLTLDMGTLLSDDKAKLRAFKEKIKQDFTLRWENIAEALELFGMVVPCVCTPGMYCAECGGARYLLNQGLNPDQMNEIGVALASDDKQVQESLRQGLERAMAIQRNQDV